MTKILAINASYRGDQGYTRFLLDRLYEGASQEEAEFEVVTLAKHKIRRCLACDQCHTPEHFLQCLYKDRDDVWAIFSRLAQADIIVYATPVYVFGISGLLKVFIDRMYGTGDVNDLQLTASGRFFHHINHQVCSKPFVTLICCDNLEAEMPRNIMAYFHTFSHFMDAPQVGELVRNGGKLAGYGRKPVRPAIANRLKQVHEAYVQAGRELAVDGHIHSSTQRRANREIVPLPLFSILKRLPPFRRVMVIKAKEMLA